MTDWKLEGDEVANCNCNFGCPCQFGVSPTNGGCEAAVAFDIKKGHYGDTSLDGVRAAGVYRWPGAIHEGNGEMQLIIDERANDAQRAALEKIMTGQDTKEMATMWSVFSTMCPTKHDTLKAPISVEIDVGERKAQATVGGVFELATKPIPHVVTGEPHRVSINLPNGFEFDTAEVASGTTETKGGAIKLSGIDATHAHLASLHLTGDGVVRA